MVKEHRRHSNHKPRHLSLPELEQSRTSVLNAPGSLQSRRSYQHAMDEFIARYCSERRLALNRAVVLRYRMHLESIPLARATVNLRLAAVRRLAYEASDSGLLSPELLAGIRRVKGVKRLGQQVGNWLTAEEGQQLVGAVRTDTLRGKRDAAMLGLLLGCGVRRSELANLEIERIQRRDGHWAIVDLVGKAGHVQTVPVPLWVKTAIDSWSAAAGIGAGRLFRAIRKSGVLWGGGVTQNVVWYVVKNCARHAGINRLAPHDLRRSCARMCHTAGGECRDEIQCGRSPLDPASACIQCSARSFVPRHGPVKTGSVRSRPVYWLKRSIGFGYRPQRAIWGLLFLWFAGSLLCWYGDRTGAIVPTQPEGLRRAVKRYPIGYTNVQMDTPAIQSDTGEAWSDNLLLPLWAVSPGDRLK